MKRRTKILLTAVLIFVGGGVGFWYFILPRVLFERTLNSFSTDSYVTAEIRRRITLIAFDHMTAEELGGHGPAVFRSALISALPEIMRASPRLVVIDAMFEAETPRDAELQKLFDGYYPYIVWAHSPENNRFFRRHGFEVLSLGHVDMIHSTYNGKRRQFIPLCGDDGRSGTVPALGLLAFEHAYIFSLWPNVTDCNSWIDRNFHVETQIGTEGNLSSLKASNDYSAVPFFRGQGSDKGSKNSRLMPIRFMGREGFFHRDSFLHVSWPQNMRPPHIRDLTHDLKDKIVMIGVTVPAAGNRHKTEVGDMDGLEIQANILATIMRVLLKRA